MKNQSMRLQLLFSVQSDYNLRALIKQLLIFHATSKIYVYHGIQGVPDKASTISKSKNTRDTKRVNRGPSLISCVCKIKM